MKFAIKNLFILYSSIGIIFNFGCKTYDSEPYLRTISIDSVGSSQIICKSEIVFSPTAILQRGVCWGINADPTVNDKFTVDSNIIGIGHSKLSFNNFNNVNYVRSYLKNNKGFYYGNTLMYNSGYGSLKTLYCDSVTYNGEIMPGQIIQKASFSIPYKDGDGGPYKGANFYSKNVSGLTVALDSGLFEVGNGVLTFNVFGLTNENKLTADFEIEICGITCLIKFPMQNALISSINCLNCINLSHQPKLVPISNLKIQLSYNGGNGGNYQGKKIVSSEVNGLSADFGNGILSNGSGIINVLINGTPDKSGVAKFNTIFLGQNLYIYVTIDNLILGQTFQGGIIGYILQPGDKGYDPNISHGLIVAENNILREASGGIGGSIWGCDGVSIPTKDSLGFGEYNTNLISTNCPNSAATYCSSLVVGNYTDWFLPSIDELNLIINNYNLYTTIYYKGGQLWSSSERDLNNSSYAIYGFSGPGPKFVKRGVMPIRRF